jgi:hypothetical protein
MGLFFFFHLSTLKPLLPLQPHKVASLSQRLILAPFKDSGSWDYCLARLFDLFVRVGFIFSFLALTE